MSKTIKRLLLKSYLFENEESLKGIAHILNNYNNFVENDLKIYPNEKRYIDKLGLSIDNSNYFKEYEYITYKNNKIESITNDEYLFTLFDNIDKIIDMFLNEYDYLKNEYDEEDLF